MTTAAAVRENDAAVRRQQRRREHRQLEPTHSASRCVDIAGNMWVGGIAVRVDLPPGCHIILGLIQIVEPLGI